MAKAIRIHRAGGPEEMRYEDLETAAPAEGEVQLRHTAIGLNYIDVYDRTGLYAMPLPGSLGREAAGVVT
ncbi:MAG: alcohol dehydrogenase catalytic domain-containing protein, partial [Gammaproteobacteria bacterium]